MFCLSTPVQRDLILSSCSALSMTLVCNPLFVRQNWPVISGGAPFQYSRIYSGTIPNYAGFIVTMGVAKVANGVLKRYMRETGVEHPIFHRVIAPAFAGALGGFFVTPTEMIALRQNRNGEGFWTTLQKVVCQEGVQALWKGGCATVIRDAIAVGIVVAGPGIKKGVERHMNMPESYATAVSSIGASSLSILCTQWAQVARMTMQSEPGYPILGHKRLRVPPATLRAALTMVWQSMGWKGFFLSSGWRGAALLGMAACEIKTNEWMKPRVNRLLEGEYHKIAETPE